MKFFFCATFSLSFLLAIAQSRPVSFNRIDWDVQSVDAPTPEILAQQLALPYKTDREKVRAIFSWITENIEYTTRPRAAVNERSLHGAPAPMDSALALKSVDEIVAYSVLKKRHAVCNGYARLFKTLCNYAGIPATIITGYARTGSSGAKFRSNHSWNAVFVDSVWQLVDVTWASGFISFATNEFIKHFDDSYFFPEPSQFIQSHYPEDMRWSLLNNLPTLREFNKSPFRLTAFIKYGISNFAPEKGVVEASMGDTLYFKIETKLVANNKMAPELNADSLMGNDTACWAFIKPVVSGNSVYYTYPVDSEQVQWVHLIYNDDVVLRYKLNILPKKYGKNSAPWETFSKPHTATSFFN